MPLNSLTAAVIVYGVFSLGIFFLRKRRVSDLKLLHERITMFMKGGGSQSLSFLPLVNLTYQYMVPTIYAN